MLQHRDNVAMAVGAAIAGLGALALVALIGWAAYTPGSNLASEIWFWPAVVVLVLIILVGLYALSSPYHGGWMPEPRRRFQMTIEQPDSKKSPIEKIEGKNVSINQSGGHTGDVVHIGTPKRRLPDGLGLTMLESSLQKRGAQTLSLTALMGNSEAYDFALQISGLIERVGWTLDPAGVSQAIYSKPLKGVVINVPATHQEDIDPSILSLGKWLADNGCGPVVVAMNSGETRVHINVGASD